LFNIPICLGSQWLEVDGLKHIEDKELRSLVEKYYVLEFKKDWQLAYNYRTNAFTETVGIDLYKKQMIKSSLGWQLNRINILSAKVKDDKVANLFIEFYSTIYGKPRRFTQDVQWVHEDDSWRCNVAGSRGIFPLNDWVTK
jgi:hypothetical protein